MIHRAHHAGAPRTRVVHGPSTQELINALEAEEQAIRARRCQGSGDHARLAAIVEEKGKLYARKRQELAGGLRG